MGSFFETNDTLHITKQQGFPKELDVVWHLKNLHKARDFEGKIFTFNNKSGVRLYQIPPVRNFLVENRDGTWIYWGLVHILEIHHDYVRKTTSGSFKVIYLNTPEEMRTAHELIDRNPETNYFK